MARRNKPLWNPNEWRAKIQASMILNRLEDHVKGNVELSATQVSAALGLLKKCMPDLQATQHSGDAEQPVEVKVTWKAPS